MTRWIDRLRAALQLGGRKSEAGESQDPAKRGPGPATTTLGNTGGPQPSERQGAAGPRSVALTPGDVIAVIAAQHEHVKSLLKAVRSQTGDRRAMAFHTLRLNLAIHETAEEQAIHPQALRQLGAYDRAANDRIAEEQAAGQAIRALELVDVDSDQFNSTFGHLAVSIADHAAAEETDEWPALQQITDPAVLGAMLEQMQSVIRLANDPSAPGIQATFSQMQGWAKSHLPAPPSS
jgi:hypothetical protein